MKESMFKKTIASIALIAGSAVILAGCSSNKPTVQPEMKKPAIESPAASAIPSSSPSSMDTSKTYTLSEVATHKSASDCWLVVDGGVYNVTDFVSKHPGGAAIVKGCGKDATSMIQGVSKHAENMKNVQAALMSMKIGTLAK